MKPDLISRMLAAQSIAGFTQTDMARWFCVRRMTMVMWLKGRNKPLMHKLPQLEDLLCVLESVVTKKIYEQHIPVPLSVSQSERADFIDEVKTDAIKRFSKNRPAGRRNKVLGNDTAKESQTIFFTDI